MTTENDPFPYKAHKVSQFTKADMSGSSFNGVDLSDATVWAVLTHAQFRDCNMVSCLFDDVNLHQAVFSNINLSEGNFNNVNLSSSVINSISHSGARFSDLNMSNVEISDANIQGMSIDGLLVTDLLESYLSNNG